MILKYIYAGLRRRSIYYFRKEYFNRQMSRRRNKCSVAGHCCKKTIPWCRHLIDGKCGAYEHQPLFCRIFPIDEKDIELSDVKGVCEYYFE